MASFEFDVEIKMNGHTINVMGWATAPIPALMYYSNGDPGHPAEGGELEDVEVWLYWRAPCKAWRKRKLCQETIDARFDDIAELVWEKLAEE